jgi:hypothetical protein
LTCHSHPPPLLILTFVGKYNIPPPLLNPLRDGPGDGLIGAENQGVHYSPSLYIALARFALFCEMFTKYKNELTRDERHEIIKVFNQGLKKIFHLLYFLYMFICCNIKDGHHTEK